MTVNGARARERTSAGITSAGAGLVGACAVGCRACGAYLFSLLGVGAGLAVLPFGGLELWVLASLLMAATLSRSWGRLDAACLDGEACPKLPDVSRRQTRFGLAVIASLMVGLIALFAVYG